VSYAERNIESNGSKTLRNRIKTKGYITRAFLVKNAEIVLGMLKVERVFYVRKNKRNNDTKIIKK
jgi:hypothetical protein